MSASARVTRGCSWWAPTCRWGFAAVRLGCCERLFPAFVTPVPNAFFASWLGAAVFFFDVRCWWPWGSRWPLVAFEARVSICVRLVLGFWFVPWGPSSLFWGALVLLYGWVLCRCIFFAFWLFVFLGGWAMCFESQWGPTVTPLGPSMGNPVI